MTVALLVALATVGAVVVLVAGDRGVRGRVGDVVGLLALVAILAGAAALPTDGAVGAGAGTGPFDRALVATAYLRLTAILWAGTGLVVLGVGALLGRVHGVLAATLGTLAGGLVALGAPDPILAAVGAIGGGLAGLAALTPGGGPSSGAADRRAAHDGPIGAGRPGGGPSRAIAAGAREARTAILAGCALLAGAAVLPIAGALALTGTGGGSAVPGREAAAGLVGLAALGVAGGAVVRMGSIPFHLRISRLTDVVSGAALPVLLAWGVVPSAVIALAVLDQQVAPLALTLDGARAILVGLAVVTLAGGALAAWIREDLRHLVGYLVVADTGLVVLGFAALDPAAWAPARTWLLVLATSKAALLAWLVVLEARFASRTIGDMRGWARRAPVLGAGYLLTVLATFGLPGWAGWEARADLAAAAAGAPIDALLLGAGLLTLPVYLRLLVVGLGRPLSRVTGAPPEMLHPFATPVGGGSPRETVAGLLAAIRDAIDRNQPLLGSGLVVVLGLVAVLVTWGVADLAGAAAGAPPGQPAGPGPVGP